MTNIYAKDVSGIKTLDPYRLQELYKMHPCAEHVVKKLLVAGEREGGKDLDHDISDCIRTLTRWQAMRAEDAGFVAKPKWATHTLKDGEGRVVFVREEAFDEFHEYGADGVLVSCFNKNNYLDGSLVDLRSKFKDSEPLNLFDWRKFPENHQWAAMDKNGSINSFRVRPERIEDRRGYWSGDGAERCLDMSLHGIDWRNSLEARPQ